ncbi:MAG TPA: tRNA (adenosine(37)-N6)-threonylcarbamoyltransferase complex ATPase subunit type 1 TsaE [Hyphomonas sp.]|nr:tRNA (adenosine(37)-N6)-threonylcarbamoyltransferase complex ATPase subunit type 1 TsaE [Hyphomonas sp.]MCA8903259.1 tRNA (adenosine(37)-N6)-threonylcarbamoyltransferase complex ATPase subunit type 1 TsaE [Hyphomonas sp.]HPE47545.1 tRNA (adenosine(37)-N6)-threonylcarbamoyltransferase complex ATPase subunit type 1 TsaE [Hyphomonas sp.]
MAVILDCPDETSLRALGARLAQMLRAGDAIALQGGLGAGKTTFARGLIAAYAGIGEVPSPTYTLVQTYDSGPLPVWHYDLYRLEDAADLTELGWDETADGIVLVEWPERAGTRLPKWRLDVTIDFQGEGRRVTLEPHGEGWQTRLHGF